jgi:hypothetical protein
MWPTCACNFTVDLFFNIIFIYISTHTLLRKPRSAFRLVCALPNNISVLFGLPNTKGVL